MSHSATQYVTRSLLGSLADDLAPSRKQFSLPLETYIPVQEGLRNSPRCRVTLSAQACNDMSHGWNERRLIGVDFRHPYDRLWRDAPDTRADCGLSARRIQRRRQRTPHDPEGGGLGAKMAVLQQPFPIGDFGQAVAFIDNMI